MVACNHHATPARSIITPWRPLETRVPGHSECGPHHRPFRCRTRCITCVSQTCSVRLA